MSEPVNSGTNFVGYEYRDITVDRDMESMYADGYQNFGWTLDNTSTPLPGLNSVTMKFKRDRKVRNKAELTRLQRQFDACINEIIGMEKSKKSTASIAAVTIGLIGTAFMAGAVFSFTGGDYPSLHRSCNTGVCLLGSPILSVQYHLCEKNCESRATDRQ